MMLETSMGKLYVELYWKHAPKTCQNFASLAAVSTFTSFRSTTLAEREGEREGERQSTDASSPRHKCTHTEKGKEGDAHLVSEPNCDYPPNVSETSNIAEEGHARCCVSNIAEEGLARRCVGTDDLLRRGGTMTRLSSTGSSRDL